MAQYTRKEFIGTLGGTVAAALAAGCSGAAITSPKKHFVTLSFDDGFKDSSIRTAEIFERFGLSACINVMATGHVKSAPLPDEYHKGVKGDFGLWRELQSRGHEIMPHGYRHANKAELEFQAAVDLIQRCLDVFVRELPGFDPSTAVFNFPYNRSTPALEEWLPTLVRAFRTGGPAINQVPRKESVKLTCTSHGPDNIDRHLQGEVDRLLSLDSGWLIYNTHALDNEGWGPVSTSFLEKLLRELTKIDSVAVVPAAAALARADAT